MITSVTPDPCSIPRLISPVKAPCGAVSTCWAATPTRLFAVASTNAGSARTGGAMTMSTSVTASTRGVNSCGWIEIEDQALETGPNEVETPSRVNGASHGAEGRFLSGT